MAVFTVERMDYEEDATGIVLSTDVVQITTGPRGEDGTDGVGVPPGGTTGQQLVKNSGTNYDTHWVTGGGGGAVDSVNGVGPDGFGNVRLNALDVQAISVAGGTVSGDLTVTGVLTTEDQIIADGDISCPAGNVMAVAFIGDGAQLTGLSADHVTTGTQTGAGGMVRATSPTLVTPAVGTATPGTNNTQAASTAFVQAAVSAAVAGLLNFKGATDCSANPNYPSAVKGDSYIVSVAGKIGGASGASVDVGDWYVCTTANAGGTEASVGASWGHLEHNLVGALLAANNLSDLANAGTARTNLGLGTLATQSGTFSGTSSGTNTGDVANTALTTGTLGQFASTTSSVLSGVISDETGFSTGALVVFSKSPIIQDIQIRDLTGTVTTREGFVTLDSSGKLRIQLRNISGLAVAGEIQVDSAGNFRMDACPISVMSSTVYWNGGGNVISAYSGGVLTFNPGWVQLTAGRSRVSSDVTNTGTTLAAITGLSATVIAGRKYAAGRLVVYCDNSVAAEGINLDFNGGSATWTSFRAAIVANVQGATLGTAQSASIATALNATAMNGTGQHCLIIEFAGVCNAGGTFIPQVAKNSTGGGGTLTVRTNSNMIIEDYP